MKSRAKMRSFRERDPLLIGIAGLTTVGAVVALAFNLQHFSGAQPIPPRSTRQPGSRRARMPALQDASAQLAKIDTKQLAVSFDSLSQTMQGSAQNFRGTLEGLQRISRAVASRDNELSELLKHTNNVTKLLADRSGDLAALVNNGGLLLQEVNARRQVISRLLTGTVTPSQQITGTIQENQATLTQALKNLHRVVNILNRNQQKLDTAVQVIAPFVTDAADITGSGRCIDNYIQNLVLGATIRATKDQLSDVLAANVIHAGESRVGP